MPFPGVYLSPAKAETLTPQYIHHTLTSQHQIGFLFFKNEAAWLMSSVGLDAWQCKTGYSQLCDSDAALASMSGVPGYLNRKIRSENANSIKSLTSRDTFPAACAAVRDEGKREWLPVGNMDREAKFLTLLRVPVGSELLVQRRGALAWADPQGLLVRIFPGSWEERYRV